MFDSIEYEYYALIDGKETKVDYCRETLVGSYCEYGDYTLYNIPYKSVEIGRVKGGLIPPIICLLLIFLFLYFIPKMIHV